MLQLNEAKPKKDLSTTTIGVDPMGKSQHFW